MKTTVLSHKTNETVDLACFKELLMRTCGFGFENEREQTLSANLSRRMASLNIHTPDAYHGLLLRDKEELLRLTELLTVNETYFFREPDHLNLMVDKLLPEFMAVSSRRPVRILSAGCSTGEEPYSIAIMLRERFGAESKRLFAITGVDIDSKVVAAAKQGVYRTGSFRGMDRTILERYFEPSGSGKFKIDSAVRKQVEFEVVNLLGASYPQRMQSPDIVLYRNVSIYFPRNIQMEIFGRLAGIIADGGCLLVGAAETFHHDTGILSLVKEDSLFFYRKTSTSVSEERRTPVSHSLAPRRTHSVSSHAAPVYAPGSGVQQDRLQAGHLHERFAKKPLPSEQRDIRERFDEAVEQAHNKQYDQALAILDAIIEEDGTFEKACCLKGSLLLSISRFDEAHIVCSAVISRNPLCLEAYLMLGIIARQKGDDDDALRRFREAIYLDASCWPAHFYSAEISYARRDIKRARNGYEAAVRVLESGALQKNGEFFFPLSFNADQFIIICRHKLSLLTPETG